MTDLDLGQATRRVPPADRCPHSLPFANEFAGCATYQPVSFVTTDSLHRPLPPAVTCRHLTVGESGMRYGRFYPRCGLGSPVARMRWLATVTPERLELTRLLQEEFETLIRPHRRRVLETKSLMMASGWTPEVRRELDRGARSFLDASERFLEERSALFEEVGLPVAPLIEVIEAWVWSWITSLDLESAPVADDAFRRLPPIAQAFLGPMGSPATAEPRVTDARAGALTNPAAAGDAQTCSPGALRILTTCDPPGIGLVGDLDVTTVQDVERHVHRECARGGDVHIDVSAVAFCDVSGLRAIVRAAEHMRDRGRLVLHGVPARMRETMRLAGWAAPAGVVFTDDIARELSA